MTLIVDWEPMIPIYCMRVGREQYVSSHFMLLKEELNVNLKSNVKPFELKTKATIFLLTKATCTLNM